MDELSILHLLSAALSLGVGTLVLATDRLGKSSWALSLYLLPLSLAALALGIGGRVPGWPAESGQRAALALFLVGQPFCLGYTQTLAPLRGRAAVLGRRAALLFAIAASIALVLALMRPERLDVTPYWLRARLHTFVGIYLLVVAVATLVHLERALRAASEVARWELKFLILGLAALAAMTVYRASRLLLQSAILDDLTAPIGVVQLPAAALILASWSRASGRSAIGVSQELAYGTITFLCVGAYLLASSLAAQWSGRLFEHGVNAEVLVFSVAALGLGTALLSTRLRHRMRKWVRRNVFAGRYDYRRYWIEASERIHDHDPPAVAARALAEIVSHAVGALDVSVWLRTADGTGLVSVASTGSEPEPTSLSDLTALEELGPSSAPSPTPPPSALGQLAPSLRPLVSATGARLLVPLDSGADRLGVVAVGSPPGGRAHDPDAAEFLQVLVGHAARELHKGQLLQLAVRAKEDEAFRSFSTFLLHDLKNFATTLGMIAENAARHAENPRFRADAFESVRDTAAKMKRICNSLRTFSGSPVAALVPLDLDQVTADALRTIAPGPPLEIDFSPCGDAPVQADREEIVRVLQNLIVNASEALGGQGRIEVATRAVDGHIEWTVRDEGPGIPARFAEEELFVPFRTTKSEGLGIGLFQCRKIVEAHGGSISIESTEGHGTTVIVRLPRSDPEAA